jgi:hypothetical protein
MAMNLFLQKIDHQKNNENLKSNPEIRDTSTFQQIVNIRLQNREEDKELVVIKEESLSRDKSHNTTTDDEGDSDLEVDEKVPFSQVQTINTKKHKAHKKPIKKHKKKRKSKRMVKKVPNFFGLDLTEAEEESVVSVYTEVARRLLMKELEGKSKSNVYEVMVNDNFSSKPKSHK